MKKAVGEGGVEDYLHPAVDHHHAVFKIIAGGGLHPRVEAKNPEGRQRCAKRYQE